MPDFLISQWDTYFGMSNAGLPKGSVNWAQTPYYQARNTWDAHATALLATPQKAKIFLKTSLDTINLACAFDVKVTLLEATNYDVKLVLVITEDSIIARQKDYAPPVGSTLGPHGINLMKFCTDFNNATKDKIIGLTRAYGQDFKFETSQLSIDPYY